MFRAAATTALLGFASAIHPYGALKKSHDRKRDIQMDITNRHIAAIVTRSCANCHSNNTKWPWYSYVPPASWLVEKDVAEAREHFTLTEWASYSNKEKSEILADIARVVSNREMPLRQYLLLHPEAKLSDEEAQALVRWAGQERRALRSGPGSRQTP